MAKLPRGLDLCPVCEKRTMKAGDIACRVCQFKMPAHQKLEVADAKQRVHKFVVQGAPVPKGRPRTVRQDDGTMKTFTPAKTKDFEQLVQQHAALSRLPPPIDGPCSMHILFVTKVAKNGNCRADIDNLSKAIMDALNGICYHDDRQVRRLIAEVIPYTRSQRTEIVVEPYLEGQ